MPVRNARRLKIARVGTSVPAPINPDGDEVLRTASSDFADRALEDVALAALRDLRFSPVGHPVPTSGELDPSATPVVPPRTAWRTASTIRARIDGPPDRIRAGVRNSVRRCCP